jgi:hypothetical protein
MASEERYKCINFKDETQKCLNTDSFWCLTDQGTCHANRESDQQPHGLGAPVLMKKWGLEGKKVGVNDHYKLFGTFEQVEDTRDELRRLHAQRLLTGPEPEIKITKKSRVAKPDLLVLSQKRKADVDPTLKAEQLKNILTLREQEELTERAKRNYERRIQTIESIRQRLEEGYETVTEVHKERIFKFYTNLPILKGIQEKINTHSRAEIIARMISPLAYKKLEISREADTNEIVMWTVRGRVLENIRNSDIPISDTELIRLTIESIGDKAFNINDSLRIGYYWYLVMVRGEELSEETEAKAKREIITYLQNPNIFIQFRDKRDLYQRVFEKFDAALTESGKQKVIKQIDFILENLQRPLTDDVFNSILNQYPSAMSGIITSRDYVSAVIPVEVPHVVPTDDIIFVSSINEPQNRDYVPIKYKEITDEVRELFKNVIL